MENINTPAQLLDLLKGNSASEQSAVDSSKLRYVLYARKSTTDDERQERSIPDQLHDCIKSAIEPNSLNVVTIIEEKCSAKEPDIRPKFRAMLDDIKAGKYDGLISWHPDRLSRNMKEAGEIIDLLDKGILKDLRFATSTFENSPTGKMLLGISFVLSKQYSEHLSESVSRGNRRITENGEFIGKLKHGYYISSDRRLVPDSANFLIIKQAFEKRLEGHSQPEIMKWLNSSGYMVRRLQRTPEPFKWDKDAIHKLLRDPVYAGVLKYGNTLVDLTEQYDFVPVVSVQDFLKINKITSLDSPKLVASMMIKSKNKVKANFLRGRVICGHCSKKFTSSLTTKKQKDGFKVTYYYYKCETPTCTFKGKNVRASVVTIYVLDFLNEHQFITKTNYDYWISQAKIHLKASLKSLDSEIASVNKNIGVKEKSYENAKNLILASPALAEHYDLSKQKVELELLEAEKSTLLHRRREATEALPTFKKYLELIANVSDVLLNEEDSDLKDSVVKVFFSNFTITDRSVSDAKLNEPWAGFVKSNNFVNGRGERTRTFDLAVPNRAR
jgi:DNA invertase Pin-like site-specific DNA recombinase